jgi:uncharacterized protein
MIDSYSLIKYLSENKARFEKEYSLIRIGIFGSVARGEQTDVSDIDIVVEFKPDTPDLYSIKFRLKEEIQKKFKTPVDICRLKYIKPVFKQMILSDIRYV